MRPIIFQNCWNRYTCLICRYNNKYFSPHVLDRLLTDIDSEIKQKFYPVQRIDEFLWKNHLSKFDIRIHTTKTSIFFKIRNWLKI